MVPGDVLMVAPGEVVPVDGAVAGSAAVLDESALTGEALPRRCQVIGFGSPPEYLCWTLHPADSSGPRSPHPVRGRRRGGRLIACAVPSAGTRL
ncbi:MAG: hypothetical protein ACLPQY_29835 [Streptosporangiaceae bacterium]